MKPTLGDLQARLATQRRSLQQLEVALTEGIERPNRAMRRAKRRQKAPPRRYLPVAHLADDELGYYADTSRQDDCFRAAIATALQTPIQHIPDLRLTERLIYAGEDPDVINAESWQTIAGWLDGRGLQIVHHPTVPVDRERWIGVCVVPVESAYVFTDHCLVMSYDRLIFDPSAGVIAPAGMQAHVFGPADVTYGLTFDPKE